MSQRFWSDAELEGALVALGRDFAYPPTPDLATAVQRRLAGAAPPRSLGQRLAALILAPLPARRTGVVVAALALILALGLLLALAPGVRTAVADRLGLRGITIQQVPVVPAATPTPTPTPSPTPPPPPTPSPTTVPTATQQPVGARLGLGQRLSLAEAQARVSFPIVTPSSPEFATPDEVYLSDRIAGGQVALVYHPRPGLPAAGETGVGLLLTEFRGDVNVGFDPVGKMAGPDTRIEQVRVNGGDGYWLEGHPHAFFYRDATGSIENETIRLAANTLVWEQGNLTLRLEGAMTRDQALRVAGSIR
jgi:hypothetical protein